MDSLNELISLADSGDHQAQATLSLAYFTGEGAELNLIEAVRYLELASADWLTLNRSFKAAREQNKAGAYYGIALMWSYGWGVPSDKEMYSKNLQQAAQLGYPRAQLVLGLDYKDSSHGVQKDLKQSEYWLLKAKQSGVTDADLHLYHLYASEPELNNKQLAASHLLQAAEYNEGLAQLYLGRDYEKGILFERDKVKATMWYLLAARHNHWKVEELVAMKRELSSSEWEAVNEMAEVYIKKWGA